MAHRCCGISPVCINSSQLGANIYQLHVQKESCVRYAMTNPHGVSDLGDTNFLVEVQGFLVQRKKENWSTSNSIKQSTIHGRSFKAGKYQPASRWVFVVIYLGYWIPARPFVGMLLEQMNLQPKFFDVQIVGYRSVNDWKLQSWMIRANWGMCTWVPKIAYLKLHIFALDKKNMYYRVSSTEINFQVNYGVSSSLNPWITLFYFG